jgi:hypothetical protein
MRRSERYEKVYEEVLRRAHPIRVRGEGVRVGVYTGSELSRILCDVDGVKWPHTSITVWRMGQRLARLYGLEARTVFEMRDMPAAVTRGGHEVRAHTRAVRVAVVLLPLDTAPVDVVK